MDPQTKANAEQLQTAAAKDGMKVDRRISTMSLLYGKECRSSFDSLRRSVQVLGATRRELSARIPQDEQTSTTTTTTSEKGKEKEGEAENKIGCFGCATAFTCELITLLESMAKSQRSRDALIANGLVEELVANNIRRGPASARPKARRVVCALVKNSQKATEALASLIRARISSAISRSREIDDIGCLISEDLELLSESCSTIPPTNENINIWGIRMNVVIDALFLALESYRSGTTPPQAALSRIVVPCLSIISSVIDTSLIDEKDKEKQQQQGKQQEKDKEKPSAEKDKEKLPPQPVQLPDFLSSLMGKAAQQAQVPQQVSVSSLPFIFGSLGVSQVPASAVPPSKPSVAEKKKARRHAARNWGDAERSGSGSGSDEDEDEESGEGETQQNEEKKPTPQAQQPKEKEQQGTKEQEIQHVVVAVAIDERIEMLAGKSTFVSISKMSKSEIRSFRLAEKYGKRWLEKTRKSGKIHSSATKSPLETLINEPWIERLLLCPESELVREESCKIALRIIQIYPERSLTLLNSLCKMVPNAMNIAARNGGDVTAQFFRVLVKLMESEERRLYLAANGFINILCSAILMESRRIESLEHKSSAGVAQGFALRVSVGLLSAILTSSPTVRNVFGKRGLVSTILESFLCLRGLISQKAKLTDDSAQALLSLLMSFREAGEADQVLFMRACVSALSSSNNTSTNRRAPAFVIEQLCNIVCPPKAEPEYLLNLQKARSQEEFIRGTMDKNPYNTRDGVGPLMRDVKNKICKTLDLRGLIDDDNGMELLVDKQIIKLDLPVARVYDLLWKPAHKDSPNHAPMPIVFRLQGLDGEATEPIIESIPDATGAGTSSPVARDPEEEFHIAAVMADCGGLEAVVKLLSNVTPSQLERDKQLVCLAFKLLSLCAKLEINRKRLLQVGAIQEAVNKIRDACTRLSITTGISVTTTRSLEEVAESAIGFAVPLSSLASTRGLIPADKLHEDDLKALLSALSLPFVLKTPSLSSGLRSLIPQLTAGNSSFARLLISYFSPHLDLNAHDSGNVSQISTVSLQAFVDICSVAPPQLKSLFVGELQVAKPLIELLIHRFPQPSNLDLVELSKPSTISALKMLLSLTQGSSQMQDLLLNLNAITILHSLEGVRTDQAGGVGLLAENVMDAIIDSIPAKSAVEACRDATKKEKLRLARKKREEILRNMGLRQKLSSDGTANSSSTTSPTTSASSSPMPVAPTHISSSVGSARAVVVAGNTPGSIETLEEEKGLSCVICREGYSFRPKDVLGFYTLEKPCPTPGASKPLFSSVTNMAMIHFRCHEDATKAEKKKKQPLDEWDAAQLRNQMTRCNNIFPVRGPDVTDDGYQAALERYWNTIGSLVSSSLKRASSTTSSGSESRLRVLIHSLKTTLIRFCLSATSEITPSSSPTSSTSTSQPQQNQLQESGGREGNLRMCTFMIQMGLHLIPQTQTQVFNIEQTLNTFILVPESAAATQQPDGSYFNIALSLILTTATQWINVKPALIRRAIATSFQERPPALPSSSTALSSTASASEVVVPEIAEMFRSSRQALLFISLVDQIHNITRSKVSDQSTSDRSWINTFYTSINSDPTSASDSVVSVLGKFDSELCHFTQFYEFFNFLGLVGNIIQPSEGITVQTASDMFVIDLWKAIKQQKH